MLEKEKTNKSAIAEQEEKIIEFWNKENIFQKSLKKDAPKGEFVFYDGPPFATGTPHYGHIVASLMKDIIPRYWTMKGYHVDRRWGWDCHGLPIENIVEDELCIKSKKEIEIIGVEKFNNTCQSKVMLYADEWKKVIGRFGRWVDMENDYKTMDLSFMESVWWVFKQLWDKDLIYEGYKSMHICPRCETTLSQSEVAEGYKDIKDISGTFKFELEDEPNTFVLAWTTTPWTLPGNVALAVGKDVDYVKVNYKNTGDRVFFEGNPKAKEKDITTITPGKYILSKNSLDKFNKLLLEEEYEIDEEFKGKELEGKKYRPLFDYYLDKNLENKENLYTIQTADFVTTEDGTGVVHIAPAFGDDDMNLGKEKNLPFIQHLKMDGRFTEDVKDFVGLEVKPKDDPKSTDKRVIKFLKEKGLVFSTEEFEHSYPHCWRCDSPLLNYATSSWFVNVTEIKKNALETAKNINWTPSHIKEGRFGNWLEGAKDWSISRQRFWGSVMPIWVCNGNADQRGLDADSRRSCGKKIVIGSVKELEELSGQKVTDLHKHNIDKITFKCECGGEMKRIPDVLDCWFESGSMPYAQIHYPFENKEKFEKNFPAQFIAEGLDQTRAWFYYLHILSSALKNSEAFKNVIVNGIVLAEDGKKMSKKLNNYPDPMLMFDKYGSDAVRYYLATSQVMKAEDLNFSEKGVDEVVKKLITRFKNVFSFYNLYSENLDSNFKKESDNVLDQWVLARLNELISQITNGLDNYEIDKASRPIMSFVDDLSVWYTRRSRDRMKQENCEDKQMALHTMRFILKEFSKVIAPFTPFVAEEIYQATKLENEVQSVHLCDWPEVKKQKNESEILENMKNIRTLVTLALEKRMKANIKVRQPLQSLKFGKKSLKDAIEYLELIKDEVNVKEVLFSEKVDEDGVELNTELTNELIQEGIMRDLLRQIQDMRKTKGLVPQDIVEIEIVTSEEGKNIIKQFEETIKRTAGIKEIKFVDKLDTDIIKIGEIEFKFKIS